MVEVKEYKTIKGNLVLKELDNKDLEEVTNYFEEGFPIYYVKKENDKTENKNFVKYETDNFNIYINPLCKKELFDGKIDTIENISKPNYKFLNHMFRFNKTLKDFSDILTRGKFEILNQYELKDIWHYYKDTNFSYTEKTGKYIGHMETKSKLDYFPTNYAIQYFALTELFGIEKREQFISRNTKKFLVDNGLFVNSNEVQYKELIKMGRFDLIDEVFKPRFAMANKNRIVIADLFAGEGEWLNLFKKSLNNNYIYTVANEIEVNRYKECVSKKFNRVFNKSYEEMSEYIPQKFIDIMLFNPPYGETDGERNVKRFYDMMIKDKFLSNSSYCIFVINQLDYQYMLPIIAKNFDILSATKVDNGNEQERLKQVVIIGRLENSDYVRNHYYINREVQTWKEPNDDFSIEFYNSKYFEGKNIKEKLEEFNVFKNPNLYKSNFENTNWSMFAKTSKVESFQGQRIKLAEKPKNLGAAANLISSGLINGEIEGMHEHCVAAGISQETTRNLDPETGNIIVTKKSSPFLSVLTAGNIIQITKNDSDNISILDDGTVVVS